MPHRPNDPSHHADDRPRSEAPSLHSLPTPTTASAHDRITGVDIRIDRIGHGEPIVILNGMLGQNEQWFPVLQTIAPRGECILIQPPLLQLKGAGGTVVGVKRVIESVLDTLIDRPAVIVGNSLGGHIALRIAMDRPELVRGLALVGSSGLFERSFERGIQKDPSKDWLDRKIRELFADDSRLDPKLIDRVHAELNNRSAARAFVKLGRSARRDYLGHMLHRVHAPADLIWGTHDAVTPPSAAREFHRLLPNARLVWLEDCGHAPQLEQPAALASAIAAFLDRLGFPMTNQQLAARTKAPPSDKPTTIGSVA